MRLQGASKPRKPHSHFAKQRRDTVSPPVLQVASSAAGRAARPQLPVAVDPPGNHRSLNARQKLLRFGQGQSQVRNIAKTFRPADLYQIGAQAAGVILCRNQPQHPSHPRSPSRLSTRPIVPPVSSYPHSLDTPRCTSSLSRAISMTSWTSDRVAGRRRKSHLCEETLPVRFLQPFGAD
jgi:hypothetical protein